MPYKSNDELPKGVRDALPSSAQSIWRNAFNAAEDKYPGDESRSARIAWGAIKNAGWVQDADKNWKKSATEADEQVAIEKAIIEDERDYAAHDFDAEIFAVGTWNNDKYTEADLDDMVKNFEALKDVVKPPIKLGHNDKGTNKIVSDGQPAYGWISKLRRAGDKLIATLSGVPDILRKAIDAGRYRRVSSEIFWNFKKGENVFRRVLSAVALLGSDIPAVTNLEDLKALLSRSTGDPPGSFETVKAYSFEAKDDWKIYEERRHESTMDDKEKIAELEKQLIQERAEKKHALETADGEKKRSFEAKKKAHKEVFVSECDSMVRDGILLPSLRDMLVEGLETSDHVYSEVAGFSVPWAQFKLVMKQQKRIIDDRQRGRIEDDEEDAKTFKSAGEEIAYLTDKALAADSKLSYADAVSKVLRANSELAQAYLEETPKGAGGGDD